MPAPLRVGLIIDSFMQPRWVRRCLEKALTTNIATLERVFLVSSKKESSSLLYKLYNRIDVSLFAADALELVDIEDLVKSAALEHGSEAQLDVLVNFAPADLNAEFAGAAKHGVWFYSFGEAPGFDEVIRQIPVTVSSLKAFKDNEEYFL